MLGEIISIGSKIFSTPKTPTKIGKPEAQEDSKKKTSGITAYVEKLTGLDLSGNIGEIASNNAESIGSAIGSSLGLGGSLGAAIGGSLLGKKKSMASTVSLTIDIVKTVEYQYTQEAPTHPIETGFEIQDNVINKPLIVNMTIGISSMPVTWLTKHGKGEHKFKDAYDALVAIRDAKQPVTITRPNMILSDMLMTSCKLQKTDESKTVMMVECTFVKITKVDIQTVEIPSGIVDAAAKDKAGETAKAGGAAGVPSVSSAVKEMTNDVLGAVKPDPNKTMLATGVDAIKGI